MIIGEISGEELHIRLWLMSCRVLKRGMENAMLNTLVKRAKNLGCKKIIGYYFTTKKNNMVADLYKNFGFQKISDTVWNLNISDFVKQKNFIKIEGTI